MRTRRVLTRLELPGEALAHVPPNWFAAVMGTGIVATSTAALPWSFPGARAVATTFWLAAIALLVGLAGLTIAHWRRHPAAARAHLDHPVTGHFYGAVPMAVLTVAAGTVTVGGELLGDQLATACGAALWVLGAVAAVVVALAVPARHARLRRLDPQVATPAWLMPVVAPMVAAAAAAVLLPHLGDMSARSIVLAAGYVLAVASLAAVVPTLASVVRALRRHGVPNPSSVPTLWIVLGPLGQSTTALVLLGVGAHSVLDPTVADRLLAAAVVYGVAALGLALGWAVLAATATVRIIRSGLPFGFSWWAFTFPVGTCVTGAAALAHQTHSALAYAIAAGAFGVLLVAWLVVAARTAHAAVRTGELFVAPVRLPASSAAN